MGGKKGQAAVLVRATTSMQGAQGVARGSRTPPSVLNNCGDLICCAQP